MTTQLYDSGPMEIGNKRSRVIIRKTTHGIEVETDSLYSDAPKRIEYYRDGNYPQLPADWSAVINTHMTTAADAWLYELEGHDPDKHINPYARSLGTAGGSSTSKRKADAARRNGKRGGRPRKQADR